MNRQRQGTWSRTSCSDSRSGEGGPLDIAFLEFDHSDLSTDRNLKKKERPDEPDLDLPIARCLDFSNIDADSEPDMSLSLSLIIPQSEHLARPLNQGEGLNGEPEFGLLNFGAYVLVLKQNDIRLEGDIINLSSMVLSMEQLEVLKLGLKFRQTPQQVPFTQIIPGIETAARQIADSNPADAAAFRSSCIKELTRAKRPKSNLTKRQNRILRELRENKLLTITSADKGGKIVIVDACQYAEMCLVHLSNEAYVSVESFGASRGHTVLINPKTGLKTEEFVQDSFKDLDPSDVFLRQQCRRLLVALNKLKTEGDVSAEDRKLLVPCQPYSGAWPRFYGLPKVHKCGPLLIRPIVSTKGLYCDPLMLHLKKILNCMLEGSKTVQNSYQFVEILNFFEFKQSDQVLSFDVESLYTKVPVPETLQIVRRKLEEWVELDKQEIKDPTDSERVSLEEVTSLTIKGIMKLLELVLSDVFFIWDSRLFHQVSGLPMGVRYPPSLQICLWKILKIKL